MRRASVIVAALAAVIAVAILLTRSGSTYQVAAIFDTSNGVIAGSEVKIAGATAGQVERVDLAPGPKARIVMSVDRKFAPFRQDATCTIVPEGLLSENFVQCAPGLPRSRVLGDPNTGLPTVPLSNTTVPASLQDLLDAFSIPTDQRLQVLINELGIATAGRGQDLNALLLRSNPALSQAQRALAIIDAQRQQLSTGIAQTNRVLAALAARGQDVRGFVDHAAALSRLTAAHKSALGGSINRLPALLDQVRPGMHSLDRAIAAGTPLLGELRAAAPGLSMTVSQTLPQFLASGTPALTTLEPAARAGRSAIPPALPVVRTLLRTAAKALPFADDLDRLLISTRDTGGIEGLLTTFYGLANNTAAYDQTSHFLTIIFRAFPQCFANPNTLGCSSFYRSPGHGTIPTDDPACGPVNSAPWAPATSCTSTVSVGDARDHAHRTARPRPRPANNAATRRSSGARGPSSMPPVAAPTAPTPSQTGTSAGSPLTGSLQPLLRYLLGR